MQVPTGATPRTAGMIEETHTTLNTNGGQPVTFCIFQECLFVFSLSFYWCGNQKNYALLKNTIASERELDFFPKVPYQ